MTDASRRPGARFVLQPVCAAAVVFTMLAGTPAWGLINPNYTPVELVNQSKFILKLELGAADAGGALPVRIVETLQGDAPWSLALRLDTADAQAAQEFKAAVGRGGKVAALLFGGDYSEASEDGVAGGDALAGVLRIGMTWFGVYPEGGGALRVGKDPLSMHTVWAGSNEMLEKLVGYVQNDYRADVPTGVRSAWTTATRLGSFSGPVHGCLAIDLFGDGRPCLLVLADGGDRLLRPQGTAATLADVTAEVGLSTRSRSAACGDFNTDGRLDLACSDGKTLTLLLMDASGKLQAQPLACELRSECTALSTLAVEGGRAGLLASTAVAPVLVVPGSDGTAEAAGLAGGAAAGAAGPCAVADFDGDALVDIVQPCGTGLLFFKNQAPGKFAPPQPACELALGDGLTTTLAGDYDADGRLDVVVGGRQGCAIFNNLGEDRFREVLAEAGEVKYNTGRKAVCGGTSWEPNNDGRPAFVLLRTEGLPHPYFNRGCRCFGFAASLNSSLESLPGGKGLESGQQAGAAADFNGDGVEELALVNRAGELWLLGREGPGLCVTVSLPPDRPDPVVVTVVAGTRPLGARLVVPGQPAFFGKRDKGPMTIAWKDPSGAEQAKQVIVLRPTSFTLGQP